MSENVNVKYARQRAWRAIAGDGLLDLVFGIMLLIVSAMLASDILLERNYIGFINIFWITLIFLFVLARNRLTHPRVGQVYVLPKNTLLTILIVIIIGLILLAVADPNLPFDLTLLLSPLYSFLGTTRGLIFAAGMGLVGYLTDFSRYYVYALAALIAGATSLIDLPLYAIDDALRTPVFLFIPGLFLAVGGTIAFARFLRDNPVLDTDQEVV